MDMTTKVKILKKHNYIKTYDTFKLKRSLLNNPDSIYSPNNERQSSKLQKNRKLNFICDFLSVKMKKFMENFIGDSGKIGCNSMED